MPRTQSSKHQWENRTTIEGSKQYLHRTKNKIYTTINWNCWQISVILQLKIKKNFMDFKTYYSAFHDPLWTLILAIALFFPVRQLIWVLYVRRKQKKQKLVSKEEINILKKRASFTSIFLSIIFSYVYVNQAFN